MIVSFCFDRFEPVGAGGGGGKSLEKDLDVRQTNENNFVRDLVH